MKKITIISALILTVICLVGFASKSVKINDVQASSYLRIHIRANSNEYVDQDIKYQVKDKVIEYITPLIANCNSKSEVQNIISNNSNNIKNLIDEYLLLQGFDYKSNIKINAEMFPTRMYDDLVLEAGVYDAIIVELGSGTGNNWWCVAYPPLCFVDYSTSGNVEYRSKLLEIINSFFSEGD